MKTFYFRNIFIYLSIFILMLNCNSRHDETDVDNNSNIKYDIYVSAMNVEQSAYDVYKNGEMMGVEGMQKQRIIKDLHYDNHQIYSIGYLENPNTDKYEGYVYKNKNIISQYANPTKSFMILAFTIDEGNIYKAVLSDSKTTIYKNNDILFSVNGMINRMIVKDGDVYSVGLMMPGLTNVVFKNNEILYYLTGNSLPNDLKFSGNDLYVIQNNETKDKTQIFKNGNLHYEVEGSNCYVFDVSGNDVYVVSRKYIGGKPIAVLYKNDKVQYEYTNGNIESVTFGVRVVDGHVFAAVQEAYTIRIFKDKELLYSLKGLTNGITDFEVAKEHL